MHYTEIRAKHYAEDTAALADDPIIVEMAQACAAAPESAAEQFQGWDFTQRAMEYYHSRGGELRAHIGAYADAVRLVMADLKKENKK
jgi:hypothetical protein